MTTTTNTIAGRCLCGFPELHCKVEGVSPKLCQTSADCENECPGGLPTCGTYPAFPAECTPRDKCFYVDEQNCFGFDPTTATTITTITTITITTTTVTTNTITTPTKTMTTITMTTTTTNTLA